MLLLIWGNLFAVVASALLLALPGTTGDLPLFAGGGTGARGGIGFAGALTRFEPVHNFSISRGERGRTLERRNEVLRDLSHSFIQLRHRRRRRDFAKDWALEVEPSGRTELR